MQNTGYRNTGDYNTGNYNTGDRNTGNRNTGYCNTITPTQHFCFNKLIEVDLDKINFPDFFIFNIIEWIYESEMTDKEKIAFPTYVTTGGYLKIHTYRQAWRNSWDKATLEDRKKVLELPGWDNEVFKEISGIDVEKELGVLAPDDAITNAIAILEKAGKLKDGKIII